MKPIQRFELPYRRALFVCAAFLTSSMTGYAQQATATPDDGSKPDDTVKLSVFNVTSTQDTGYSAADATPFKTKQQMVDIPQAITVVTRDMIQDISGYDSSDVLPFAGVIPKYGAGETFQLRGLISGATYPLLDGQIDQSVFSDNVFIDSINVIRGPAALLYPNSSLGGVINKLTRRPQPRASNALEFSVTDFGLYRGTFDSTGPVGKLGDGQLDYRLIGAFQRGDSFFNNVKDDRTVIHPELQWNSKNTTVYVALDYEKFVRPSNPTGLLQPNGVIFTGLGLNNSLLLPKNVGETHILKGVRGSVVQRLGENWETVVGVNADDYHRTGSIVLPLNANWDTRTVGFYNRLNDIALNHASFSIDTNGTYDLFGMKSQTTFGMNITIQRSETKLYANTNFGGPGQTYNYRSIDNPNVATLPVEAFKDYVVPANPGSLIRSEFSNFYIQQSIDVLPDRLTLIGGIAKYKDATTN
ncbi:MAG: TonB-dependent receptor plug domain-containing protein, partial [Opitutaceae bacterium]